MKQSDESENPLITIRRAAMNLLARREHSFHELTAKITVRYPDLALDDVILPALQRLLDEGLQSDTRFTESYVRYRGSRGFGPLKIAAELYQKGVSSDLIKRYLYEQGPDWFSLCSDALQKKFPEFLAMNMQEKQKCQRFLLQRGFEHGDISQLLFK